MFGWGLCFPFQLMLRCEVQLDSFTVLLEPSAVVMDKWSLVPPIQAGPRIVSFPLLNTPMFSNICHHSAVKEMAPRRPIYFFCDLIASRSTCKVPPFEFSDGLPSCMPAGLKTELRSPGYLWFLDLQSRFPFSLLLRKVWFLSNIGVSEGLACYSNIGVDMPTNPTYRLSL